MRTAGTSGAGVFSRSNMAQMCPAIISIAGLSPLWRIARSFTSSSAFIFPFLDSPADSRKFSAFSLESGSKPLARFRRPPGNFDHLCREKEPLRSTAAQTHQPTAGTFHQPLTPLAGHKRYRGLCLTVPALKRLPSRRASAQYVIEPSLQFVQLIERPRPTRASRERLRRKAVATISSRGESVPETCEAARWNLS